MKLSPNPIRAGARMLALGLVVGLFGVVDSAVAKEHLRIDPAKVVGAKICAECHEFSVRSWYKTRHFKTFAKLHKSKKARAIYKKMKLKGGIKARKNTCASCHYTYVAARKRPVAGITCESCHGAAKDWVVGHRTFGGSKDTAQTRK